MPLWLFRTIVSITLGLPHVGFVLALYLLFGGRAGPIDFGFTLLYFFLGGFGITIGFHRFATHGSFKTSGPVKALLFILGSMAGVGTAIWFIANHREHHEKSDQKGDPHSPVVDDLVHSHIGWLFSPAPVDLQRYAPDHLADPLVVWIDRLYPLWAILAVVLPVGIQFGIQGSVWNGFVCSLAAACIRYHFTWAVNSGCHSWGSHPYNTGDRSTNNWIVGILGLGEGWHNNHHADPRSAFHGHYWWQIDVSSYVIRLMERIGLVWDVQRPNEPMLARKRIIAVAI